MKIRQRLWWILILLIVWRLLEFLFWNREAFIRPYDGLDMGRIYSQSQYVKGSGSEGIGDDGLYAFAGYYYLLEGGDVSSVNFEHPPLGKYLIGISIWLFQNQNIISLFYLTGLLVVTYRLGMLTVHDRLFSLVAVFLLLLNPLLMDHVMRSMLDLPFTLFFTCALYYFLRGKNDPRYYLLSNLFWVAAFSTRFFPFLAVIITVSTIWVYAYQRKALTLYGISLLFIPLLYLLSHAMFFVYHPSFGEFIAHKKWMISWFRGSPIIVGNIWRVIIDGHYLDATGAPAYDEHWNILFPIVVFAALSGIVWWKKKNNVNPETRSLYALCILYLGYVTFLTYGVAKFVMHIYPLLTVLAMQHVKMLYSIMSQRHGKRSAAAHPRKTR